MNLSEIISQYMPSENSIRDMCEFFSVFGQETRIRLVSLLSISPLTVGEIAHILTLNQTTVSHQLRILKDRKIVNCTRNGKEMIYALANAGVNEIMLLAVKITENKTLPEKKTFDEKCSQEIYG